MDQEVSITDASPTGGGGAVARSFKYEPDTSRHDGNYCRECGRRLETGRSYPCPAGCKVALCSLSCISEHREASCRRKNYVMPKFGERFSGPNAPLSQAVARGGGIEVQEPFDLERGHDFFTDAGRKQLEALEGDPALAAEHWGPECRLFSRARGKPVKLPDGRTIPGPQAVRDKKHVMGFPWATDQMATDQMKIQLRRSNKMALRALKRAKSEFGRRVTVEHPYNSWLWSFTLAEELVEDEFEYATGTNCSWGGDRIKWYAVLNNSEEILEEVHRPLCEGHESLRGYDVTLNPDGSLKFATEEESEDKIAWCEAYARGLKAQFCKNGWIQKAIFEGRVQKVETCPEG